MSSLSDTNQPAVPAQPQPPAKPARLLRARRHGLVIVLALAPVLLIPIAGWWLAGKVNREKPVTHQVRRERLQRAISARGDLEAAETSEIVCRVKSRTPGRTSSTTIKSIVPDGSRVERGQLLVEFDDSALQDELQASRTPLELGKADWILAEKNLEIIRSQNETDIKTAEVNLQLAELDYQKYLKGDYEQTRKEVLGRLTQAETDVRMWLDRASWTTRMTRRGYATPSQNQAEQSRLKSAAVAEERIKEELRVLERYTFARTKKDLEGKVAEARRALERLKSQARAKEVQADADTRTKERIYALWLDRYHGLEEQIAVCRIVAPHDGMVIYHQSKQSKSGSGSQMSMVAQGEPVFEGQKLMAIPDLSRQLVRVRIPEATIARVHGEEYEPTGFSNVLQATLSLTPGVGALLINQAVCTELRPHFHNRDRRMIYGGQPALVHVEVLAGRSLHGHVKYVANVPAQFEARSSDLRYFDALIAIDETFLAVRPDLSADVTILDDDAPAPVLAVPFTAVVHTPGTGTAGTCYVVTPEGPEAREVQLGSSDERVVEVRDGLTEGDEIVLDPGSLKMKH